MKHIIHLLIASILIIGPIRAEESQTFGKTHFIIGHPSNTTETQQTEIDVEKHDLPYNLMCNNCIKSAYFSPDDDVRSLLLYLIEQEKKSIRIAMFSFTEGKIAQALIDAQERGIHVEIVADQSNLYSRYSKLPVLHQGHVNIFIYNGTCIKKNVTGLMHNKFILFGNNILDKSLVCTGSFNFTRAAHRHNQENILVLDDTLFIEKYNKKFEQLRECSDQYHEKNTIKNSSKK